MKLKKTVSLILMLPIIVMSSAWCSGTRKTDKEQLAEVTQLATKRFVGSDYTYYDEGEYKQVKCTGVTVYPLYNENDVMKYFLLDFEPYGYAYVRSNIGMNNYVACVKVRGDYTLSEGWTWRRYYRNINDTGFDYNEDGEKYIDSHFKVAGIKDEKRYLLYYDGEISTGYIPAVKRGDKFLNLVSMTEYDPNNLYLHEPTGNVGFIGKHPYDL